MVLVFLCKITLLPNWQNKIGQYSILESFEANICKRWLNIFTRWSSIIYLHDQEKMGINMGCLINNRKAGVPTNVHNEIKKAIVQSLKASDGQLSNGLSSLTRNGLLEHFSWACRQETQTHTILIWHIATGYCLGVLKFNSHHINVPLNAWSTKCRLTACMSAQIRSNFRDESIKPN
jgi:hypothetical protein